MSRFILTQVSRLQGFAKKILPQKLSQYHYGAFFVFLLVLFFGFTTQFAHAGVVEWIVQGISSMLLSLAQIAMALAIFFLRYFITLASYNDYINVSVVKLGWVMVRDVANMFFVVSLLVIAFATILGIEKYEWKKSLVKLIAMAILINFSNLIAQLIIDAAHVFTITFLNAVSASAGGNLINMFSMDHITKIITNGNIGDNVQGATLSIFGASALAFVFAAGTAVTIGAYAIVMVLRIVVLWALIILSPLAYLFSALPKGEKYASKWWSEFTNHVIVAPVMVFFLWLAFATLGTGHVIDEIKQGNTIPLQQSSEPLSASLTDISTWDNMANYILAMIFLLIGLKITKETGATGSSIVGSAEGFINKTGKLASGYVTGRWLAGKAKKAAIGTVKGVGKFVFNRIPVVGGHALQKYKYGIATWNQKRLEKRDKTAQEMDKDYRKIQELKMQSRTGSDEDKEKALGELAKYSRSQKFGAVLGRLAASAWQTSGRTEKEIEDYKDTFERTKKYRELKYSTSSLGGGIAKQEITGKLQIQETISAGKKTQKGEDMLRRLTQDTSSLTEEEKLSGELPKLAKDLEESARKAELAKTKHEVVKGDLSEKYAGKEDGQKIAKQLAEARANIQSTKIGHEAIEAIINKEFKASHAGQKIAKKIAEGKATISNIQEEASRSGRLLEAQERANEYRKSGQEGKADQVMRMAYQEIEEENAKKYKSMSIGERSAEARKQMMAIAGETDSNKKARMQRDQLSLLQYIDSLGVDSKNDAEEKMLGELYKDKPEGADRSTKNQGKLRLEFLTGEIITKNEEFEKADAEVNALFTEGGQSQKNAVLSNWLNKAMWPSLEGGGVSATAAIEAVDDEKGSRNYQIFNPFKEETDAYNKHLSETYKGIVKWIHTKQLNGLDGISETKRVGEDTYITGLLKDQEDLFVNIMTQFKDERAVADGFNAQFSSYLTKDKFENTNEGKTAKKQIINALHKVLVKYQKMGKEKVAKALLSSQYSDFIQSLNSSDGSMSEVLALQGLLSNP
ncbi:MAG: hypothetical protein WC025_03585 [Candidatus Magasanikbacteria bacterium]